MSVQALLDARRVNTAATCTTNDRDAVRDPLYAGRSGQFGALTVTPFTDDCKHSSSAY